MHPLLRWIVNFLPFIFHDCSNITSTRGKYTLWQLRTLQLLLTAQMLSKLLAMQLLRTHRPSFWQCEREGLMSYCLCAVTIKNPSAICCVSTDKVIWIFFFSEVGPFYYYPLISCVCIRWVLLATDIGLS